MKTAFHVLALLAACVCLHAESHAPSTPAPKAEHGQETELNDKMDEMRALSKNSAARSPTPTPTPPPFNL